MHMSTITINMRYRYISNFIVFTIKLIQDFILYHLYNNFKTILLFKYYSNNLLYINYNYK